MNLIDKIKQSYNNGHLAAEFDAIVPLRGTQEIPPPLGIMELISYRLGYLLY